MIKLVVEAGEIGNCSNCVAVARRCALGGAALDLHVLGSHVLNLAHLFRRSTAVLFRLNLSRSPLGCARDVVQGAEGVGLLVGNQLHAVMSWLTARAAVF